MGRVLDEDVVVLEGEIVGIVDVIAFLVILLLGSSNQVASIALGLLSSSRNQEICVVDGLNVFFLVHFLGLGLFLCSNSFPFHFIRLSDRDGNNGIASDRMGVGVLGWSPGDKQCGVVFGHAIGVAGDDDIIKS